VASPYRRAFRSLIKTLVTFMMHNVLNSNRLLATIACVVFLSLLIAACKKDKGNGFTGKLMNKWSLVQILDTVYYSGAAPAPAKYDGKTGEYLDFRKDGKLYSFLNGTYDTANYTYSESNFKLNVKGFQYEIQILTDNTMILHEPHFATSTQAYTAYKVTLMR